MDGGGCVEGWNTGAACPDPLGKSALRHQFQSDPAGAVHLRENGGTRGPGKRADDLGDLTGPKKGRYPHQPVAGIVADNGQVGCPVIDQGVNEFDRAAGLPETADHDSVAVVDPGYRFSGIGDSLIDHAARPRTGSTP